MERPVFTPPFTSIDNDENRRALRRAVKMRAHLRDRGQTKFEIDVVDLSSSGFRAETSFTLWPGTVVWLTLPGLAPLEAVVAWRDKFAYGCAFHKPLHPAVFDHIVALGNREPPRPVSPRPDGGSASPNPSDGGFAGVGPATGGGTDLRPALCAHPSADPAYRTFCQSA